MNTGDNDINTARETFSAADAQAAPDAQAAAGAELRRRGRRERQAPDDEAGRGAGRRQPRHRLARRQRRAERPPRPGGARPRGGRAARLPPQPDRQLAAPGRSAVGEHRPHLRGRRQPVLLRRAPRRRGRGPPARRADLRGQLRRAARARARAGRVVQRAGASTGSSSRPPRPTTATCSATGRPASPSSSSIVRRASSTPTWCSPTTRAAPASRSRTSSTTVIAGSPSSAIATSCTRPPSACAATATPWPATASGRRRRSSAESTTGPTQLTRELLLADDPPTALFTSQNLITIDAVRAIHDLRLQRRVALVGFDDVALADVVEPGLTVIAQDPTALGRSAAELLFSRLDGYTGPSRRVVHPTTLIPRGSGELTPGGRA